MSIPPKAIYRFSAIPINLSTISFTELEQIISQFVWGKKNIYIYIYIYGDKPKLGQGLLFSLHLLGWPTLTPQGCIFLYFLNKMEL